MGDNIYRVAKRRGRYPPPATDTDTALTRTTSHRSIQKVGVYNARFVYKQPSICSLSRVQVSVCKEVLVCLDVMVLMDAMGYQAVTVEMAQKERKAWQECEFHKTKDNSALHGVYQGNVFLGNCKHCCKRRYITFNSAECSGPLPIEAALFIRDEVAASYRPLSVEAGLLW